MIDYQRLFHTGIRVADLDAAMVELGSSLGLTWAEVRQVKAQGVWTPEDGVQQLPLRFVYSCHGPKHVELLQGSPGSIVELVDATIEPGFQAWWAAGLDQADGSTPST